MRSDLDENEELPLSLYPIERCGDRLYGVVTKTYGCDLYHGNLEADAPLIDVHCAQPYPSAT